MKFAVAASTACTIALCAVGSHAFVVVAPRGSTSPLRCTVVADALGSLSLSGRRSSSTNLSMVSQDRPSPSAAVDRRNFLSAATSAALAAGLGLGVGAINSSPAVAAGDQASGQLGDLDAGSPTPMASVKITEGEPLSAESSRIQRKLAAQAKVTGKSSSGKMTYAESRAAEDSKQSKLKAENSDKARRRAAMCEELGRGC